MTLLRIFGAIALLAACSRSDAAAKSSTSSSGANAKSATAAGSVGPAAMPHDSISDLADRGRIAGDASATIWVVMASDFQCPFCKQWHDAQFATVMNKYAKTGKIRLAFLNMPLSIHPNAMPAAEAAMCASVQDKFWPMHEALFESQSKWESLPNAMPTFDSLAAAHGVNMPQWRDCTSRHLTAALITADHDRARASGVRSTPTFFVNNKLIAAPDGSSAGAAADVPSAIDAELKKAR
jgi:protein-disulfide isomerase